MVELHIKFISLHNGIHKILWICVDRVSGSYLNGSNQASDPKNVTEMSLIMAPTPKSELNEGFNFRKWANGPVNMPEMAKISLK